jgi:hypothetical protein
MASRIWSIGVVMVLDIQTPAMPEPTITRAKQISMKIFNCAIGA